MARLLPDPTFYPSPSLAVERLSILLLTMILSENRFPLFGIMV